MSDMRQLKDEVIRVARAAEMDLVGVAPIDRFRGVHHRMRPEAHLPGAQAVVAMAMRYPRAMYELAGNTEAESFMSLDSYENHHMVDMLMLAAMDVTRYLEKAGYLAIPMQITHYRVRPYKDIQEEWTQDFDHRVAAVAAGLGELGLNGEVITHAYGTRQKFIAVVTDAPLPADPLYSGPGLCDRCLACVKTCHMQALRTDDLKKVQIGSRTFEVAQKDIWRCLWSKRFMLNADAGPKLSGMNVTINPPAGRIAEADVQKAQAEKGRRGGMQTWYMYADRACERNCIPPHMRTKKSLLEQQKEKVATAGA
jgi:ferredoxin